MSTPHNDNQPPSHRWLRPGWTKFMEVVAVALGIGAVSLLLAQNWWDGLIFVALSATWAILAATERMRRAHRDRVQGMLEELKRLTERRYLDDHDSMG